MADDQREEKPLPAGPVSGASDATSATAPDPARAFQSGLFAPFRVAIFRWVWFAMVASNLGTWMQNVGATWSMTTMDPSPHMVALVQAAMSAPLLVFALIAGAVADVFERRVVMIASQCTMLAIAASLAVLQYFGFITPWLLLGLTFLLGSAQAFMQPAWNASVGEMVPRALIPSAVALNSTNFNLSRTLGPALGGAVVAAFGSAMAFALNAASYLGLIAAFAFWRRGPRESPLPRERLSRALLAGVTYVRESPPIQTVLVRSISFGMGAAAIWSLLPVVAVADLGLGATGFGLLVGAMGVGAVLAATVFARVTARLGGEGTVSLAYLGFAAANLVMAAFMRLDVVVVALVLAGVAWLFGFSSFNTLLQLSAPNWVKARAMAIYQALTFGCMALGAWGWGVLATHYGTRASLLGAGLWHLASLALRHRYRLPGQAETDLRPSRALAEPKVALEFDASDRPVHIAVEYRIDPEDAAAFVKAMRGVRRIRRRDGAMLWRLWQDVAEPGRWLETFQFESWHDYLRQRAHVTVEDQTTLDHARHFHRGEGPLTVHRHVLHDVTRAVRVDVHAMDAGGHH